MDFAGFESKRVFGGGEAQSQRERHAGNGEKVWRVNIFRRERNKDFP